MVGNFEGTNPFYLHRSNNICWSLTGHSFPGTDWAYNGFVRTGDAVFHHGATTPEPTDNQALSHALAATNPNKPHVSLPNFVAELRDYKFREIPAALKKMSRFGANKYHDIPIARLKDIGSDYLTYEYGIKPFMQDVGRMMDFVNRADMKYRYLEKLRASKTGLGNSATVWNDETFGGVYDSYVTGLYSESNVVRETWKTVRKKWVSTMWTPTVDMSQYTDDNLRALANRIVTGSEVSFAALWDAMPWTWLIDWFSNAGDMYSLSRNSLPVSHNGSCVMTSIKTGITSAVLISGGGLTSCKVHPNAGNRVTLNRVPLYGIQPRLEFNLPLFDGRQLSILSAIGVTRL